MNNKANISNVIKIMKPVDKCTKLTFMTRKFGIIMPYRDIYGNWQSWRTIASSIFCLHTQVIVSITCKPTQQRCRFSAYRITNIKLSTYNSTNDSIHIDVY